MTAGDSVSAHPYDGEDPYRTGCARTKVNTGKKASLKNEVGDRLGTIRLFYSRHCGTNWGEVSVPRNGSGEITVFTSGVCAKATGSVTAGIGRANKGSGTTPKACD